MAEQNNVVELRVKPKTLNRIYKTHRYKVTYVPSTKKWKWTVSVVSKMEYSDVADTQTKAFKAAEKFIDKTMKAV